MSRESLETKVGQVEEGRETDSQVGPVSPGPYGSPIIKYIPSSHSLPLQVAKYEGSQDVTYVQMCRRTLRLGIVSSHHFQAGENPKESVVYATLEGTGPSPVFKNKE